VTERPKLTLERTFQASIEEAWELWTTKEGIESWWGPEGFSVAVRDLDLQPGGKLVYEMTATGPDQVEYMIKSGMPLTTVQHFVYTQVEPPRRLAYRDTVDFVPGMKPYEVDNVIELHETAGGVRMVLTFEGMHDDHWTRMATLGRESQLARLDALLASRR
jgi:uncharacterized protein YndB with AHSA1/START domain